MQIIDCVQGTPEWHAARCGIITASRFSDALAGGGGKVRSLYMRQLAGEIINGRPMTTYRNAAMERGSASEAEGRSYYSLLTNKDVQEVGFIVDGRFGCSPDGLIGDDGMLELKSTRADLLIERLLDPAATIPSEHMAQLQGNLWVSGRDWIEIGIFDSDRMPMWRRKVRRDMNAIRRLETGLLVFVEELDAMVDKIKRIGSGR